MTILINKEVIVFGKNVEYDFDIGQQFEHTTDMSIGFSRTGLKKKF
ncbi:MAG: hypothetical protein GY823_02745 [Flavobacteriaceae bacterium]|nr:hypothetical protein [Flavobacteriaceae bacterium]